MTLKKIGLYILALALIFSSPAWAGRDAQNIAALAQQTHGAMEEVPLVNKDGTPNNTESGTKKTDKAANRFFWGVMSCFCASALTLSSLFAYYVINAHNNPTNTMNGCSHVCWYLHEKPSLPQGGYFYQDTDKNWIFTNCASDESTILSTTSAQEFTTTLNAITTTYPGQVEFMGMHDGYAVCTHPELDDTIMPDLVDME